MLEVVEIFDRVQKQVPSRLLMIGDGPDRAHAEWLTRKKGLQSRVHFLGKTDNVENKLAISDLMLMPSELESFGLAALEAMACKVPAISTNVGGVPELIEHGKSGMLANVGDVATMSKYAIDLLSDEKALRTMGETARYEAQARFCSTKIIAKYEQVYARVLSSGS